MMATQSYYYLINPLNYTGALDELTYSHDQELPVGSLVRIPIGRTSSLGVVIGPTSKPSFKTKPITEVIDLPPLPNYLVDLADWMSQYYLASRSSVWSTMLPTGITKNRRTSNSTPKPKTAQGLPTFKLTSEQTEALLAIRSDTKRAQLLFGVTGSGKTRIYLELAAEALAAGRSVIILIPEITLAQQVVEQFETVFGDTVLSSHSKLTEAQRHAIWNEANISRIAGQPRIIVGPRSCLFMPLHDLGLIVVDECHETSYKQEQNPRYSALAVAARLGQLTDSRVVFGSATPGLNELFLAQAGRLQLVIMKQRTNNISLPQATIIDLRNKELFKVSKFFTQPLIEAIGDTLASGRQTLLYLNRRGSATSQVCGDCGYVSSCPNCQLPLTFHADLMRLICHHCNFRQISPAVCPDCNGSDLKLLGGGTKRIEAEVEQIWPEARVARLDRDSATLSHIKAVYTGLRNRTIDIVIGTQMIAKGLDLPGIDTIGIVSADTMLRLPDFTAAERTFQLLSQVAGRAGRGDRAGQIFIQTYAPEHPAIVAASTYDYATFATAELAQRQLLGYPPYAYLAKLSLSGKTREAVQKQSEAIAQQLRQISGLRVSGPAPSFLENIGGAFHWIISVSSPERSRLVTALHALPPEVTVDLDPINLL